MKETIEMTKKLNELNWQFFVEKEDGNKYPFDDVTCMDLKCFQLESGKREREFISSLGYRFFIETDEQVYLYDEDGNKFNVFKSASNNRFGRSRPDDNAKNSID